MREIPILGSLFELRKSLMQSGVAILLHTCYLFFWRFLWVTRSAWGGLTKKHNAHKEEEEGCLLIIPQFPYCEREKCTTHCLRQWPVEHERSSIFRIVSFANCLLPVAYSEAVSKVSL